MITPEVIAQHNLTPDEFNRINELLGREPNLVELGVFSVMWSEHCSYKSSRVHLKRLPTSGERVIVPPGENAGVVDVGDGWCAAFKIESHNHPSFIEPFQGAATGVGGILRDIFTMGARPIAALNSLRFGSLDDPKNGQRNRSLLAGVVAGIAHYGNAFGVPTIGGEVAFDDAYALNPLVNAFALGLVRKDQIFFGKASGVGNPVLYVGAKTGRDGREPSQTRHRAGRSARSRGKRSAPRACRAPRPEPPRWLVPLPWPDGRGQDRDGTRAGRIFI